MFSRVVSDAKNLVTLKGHNRDIEHGFKSFSFLDANDVRSITQCNEFHTKAQQSLKKLEAIINDVQEIHTNLANSLIELWPTMHTENRLISQLKILTGNFERLQTSIKPMIMNAEEQSTKILNEFGILGSKYKSYESITERTQHYEKKLGTLRRQSNFITEKVPSVAKKVDRNEEKYQRTLTEQSVLMDHIKDETKSHAQNQLADVAYIFILVVGASIKLFHTAANILQQYEPILCRLNNYSTKSSNANLPRSGSKLHVQGSSRADLLPQTISTLENRALPVQESTEIPHSTSKIKVFPDEIVDKVQSNKKATPKMPELVTEHKDSTRGIPQDIKRRSSTHAPTVIEGREKKDDNLISFAEVKNSIKNTFKSFEQKSEKKFPDFEQNLSEKKSNHQKNIQPDYHKNRSTPVSDVATTKGNVE